MLGHARYLFEYAVIQDKALMQELNDYFGKGNQGQTLEYLFDVFRGYFHYYSGPQHMTSAFNAYNLMNVVTEENINQLILQSEDRNQIESDLPDNFDGFSQTYTTIVAEKNYLKLAFKEDTTQLIDGSNDNLIANWISKTCSINELAQSGKPLDFKVVISLRGASDPPELSDVKKYIQQKIRKKNQKNRKAANEAKEQLNQQSELENQKTDLVVNNNGQGQQEIDIVDDESTNLDFLYYLVSNYDLLSKYQSLIFAHIDIVNYIRHKFDYRISYQLACSLSILDLVHEPEPQQYNFRCLDLPLDPTDEEIAEYEAQDLMVQKHSFVAKYGCDQVLEEKFYALFAAWDYIKVVREKYPQIFDFRFLCHANALPDDQIKEITSMETAKLIYFMPSDKYVESLFITSALQTLSKYQNYLIKTFSSLYKSVNSTIPLPISPLQVQSIDRHTIINFDADLSAEEANSKSEHFSELISIPSTDQFLSIFKETCFSNPKFNTENNHIFSLSSLLTKLVHGIFKKKPALIFEGDYFQNFNFTGSYGEVGGTVIEISQMIKQKELGKYSYKKLLAGLMQGQQSIMGIFAAFAQKVEQWRNMDQGAKGFIQSKLNKMDGYSPTDKGKYLELLSLEEIDFCVVEARDSADTVGMQEEVNEEDFVLMRTYRKKQQEASNLLNSVKITLGSLREAWELIEDHMYEYAVGNLDIIFKEDLSKSNLKRIKKALGNLDDEEMEVLQRVCKSVLLRQLVGTTRQNIAEMSVKDCLEWSDALHEDEELNEAFLEELGKSEDGDGGSEILMKHLYSIINNF